LRVPIIFRHLAEIADTLNELINEGHASARAQDHLILNLGIMAGISMEETVLLLEHCHVVQFVAILEHGDKGLP
jgi:hypothetical protein